MIELKHISKSFGDNRVLDDISLCFEPGKVNMIIGASGSGKSVLMKIMVGLHMPDQGQIVYDGIDFVSLDRKEQSDVRKKIGMLFQNSALFDSMTVEENVLFPLKMFSPNSPAENLERVNFCLERVGLSNTNKRYPAEISGGMKKRVGIARAIVLNPKYLFCDEPNSGLDPLTAILIDELIKEITLEFNITTVVNSHDMNSVMEIGDQIAYIHKGRKAWHGDKKSILTTNNDLLNEFVFATAFLKQFRDKSR
ncbi:MAG: ABC transporter ATP-binding protein [Bacteroidia bacterium]|jgi:phospholipid/cholesterol/gamma-HCH transport system ATP-binding protein